uniref:FZ domain-containing protein n=1 Tax=Anguilla anguilla TaxID=7936 RepID=A0A0E9XXT2_ANGAN
MHEHGGFALCLLLQLLHQVIGPLIESVCQPTQVRVTECRVHCPTLSVPMVMI